MGRKSKWQLKHARLNHRQQKYQNEQSLRNERRLRSSSKGVRTRRPTLDEFELPLLAPEVLEFGVLQLKTGFPSTRRGKMAGLLLLKIVLLSWICKKVATADAVDCSAGYGLR